MFLITAQFSVTPNKRKSFLSLITKLITSSKQEKGCIEYSLFSDRENADKFILIEKWESQSAIESHNNSEHFKTIVPILAEMNNESTIVNTYENY